MSTQTNTAPAAQPAPVQEPVAWVDLLKQAEEVVRSKSLWKKYIDGTPLANDIAVWMASFAQEHTNPPSASTQDIPDLIAGALGVSRGTAYDMMREALKDVEPVATVQSLHVDGKDIGVQAHLHQHLPVGTKLYTTPPAAPVQEPVECQYGNGGYACCEGRPCKADEQNNAAAAQDGDHEFKNFHRHLCEHFGYTHDEIDWKRDQVSLIEWIAKQVNPAAPAQEPVAIVSGYYGGQCVILPVNPSRIFNSGTAFYTTPPAAQRQWVGLTPREIYNLWEDSGVPFVDWDSFASITRAIEAKLRNKNGWRQQHVTDGNPCWCEPETRYTDPETGVSVIVHKDPQ